MNTPTKSKKPAKRQERPAAARIIRGLQQAIKHAKSRPRSLNIWVLLPRCALMSGQIYKRLDHDLQKEWKGWKRATLTLDPPKKARKP